MREGAQVSQNVVSQLSVKSHNTPDEQRRPDKAAVDVVTVGDYTIGRFKFEPGWRWSESIKPLVKTDSCQNSHVGFCVSGSLVVETSDGKRINITEGDSYTIPPGHDAWVEGNDSFTGIEFLSAATFAKATE
jgi:quercetin dioxygenase-like cupin family protein